MRDNNFKTKIPEATKVVKQQIVGYIVAALSLVAGLAWNDAVKATIEYFFPANNHTFWAKIMYAILISIIVVVISYILVRGITEEEKK